MAFSSSTGIPPESNNPILQKLKKRSFTTSREEGELLNQLMLEPPRPSEFIWMLTDINKRYQDIAAKLLEPYHQDKQTYNLLLNEFRSKGNPVRKSIARVVGRLGFSQLQTDLYDFMHSPNKDNRLFALEILALHPRWEDFLGLYKAALKDPDQEIRLLALQKLASRVQNETIFLMLLPLVHDEQDEIRHLAIRKLAESEGRTELVEAFFARLSLEPLEVQQVITAFIGRLSRNPQLKLEERLIPVLADENESSRNLAVQILQEMPNKREIIKKFLIYTRGIVVWLRDRCFESFGKIAYRIADDVISLLEDSDPTIRIESMFLAAYINDPRIIPGVSRILESGAEWWIRVSAVEILSKFKQNPEVSRILHHYIEDDELQWSIISALGKIQDFSSMQVLVKFLKSPNKFLRLETLKSLGSFPDLSALPIFVMPLAKKDPEMDVRNAAIELLEKAGKKSSEIVEAPVQQSREKEIALLKKMGIEMEEEEYNQSEEKDSDGTSSSTEESAHLVSPPSSSNLTSLFSNQKLKP